MARTERRGRGNARGRGRGQSRGRGRGSSRPTGARNSRVEAIGSHGPPTLIENLGFEARRRNYARDAKKATRFCRWCKRLNADHLAQDCPWNPNLSHLDEKHVDLGDVEEFEESREFNQPIYRPSLRGPARDDSHIIRREEYDASSDAASDPEVYLEHKVKEAKIQDAVVPGPVNAPPEVPAEFIYTVAAAETKQRNEWVKRWWPKCAVKWIGGSHSHPRLAVERALGEHSMSTLFEVPDGKYVVSIGGAQREERLYRNLHRCNPILSWDDEKRDRVGGCLHKAEECQCVPRGDIFCYVASHVYTLTPEVIWRLCGSCISGRVYLLCHFLDGVGKLGSGDGADEATYFETRSGQIRMSVCGQPEYRHPANTWMRSGVWRSGDRGMVWTTMRQFSGSSILTFQRSDLAEDYQIQPVPFQWRGSQYGDVNSTDITSVRLRGKYVARGVNLMVWPDREPEGQPPIVISATLLDQVCLYASSITFDQSGRAQLMSVALNELKPRSKAGLSHDSAAVASWAVSLAEAIVPHHTAQSYEAKEDFVSPIDIQFHNSVVTGDVRPWQRWHWWRKYLASAQMRNSKLIPQLVVLLLTALFAAFLALGLTRPPPTRVLSGPYGCTLTGRSELSWDAVPALDRYEALLACFSSKFSSEVARLGTAAQVVYWVSAAFVEELVAASLGPYIRPLYVLYDAWGTNAVWASLVLLAHTAFSILPLWVSLPLHAFMNYHGAQLNAVGTFLILGFPIAYWFGWQPRVTYSGPPLPVDEDSTVDDTKSDPRFKPKPAINPVGIVWPQLRPVVSELNLENERAAVTGRLLAPMECVTKIEPDYTNLLMSWVSWVALSCSIAPKPIRAWPWFEWIKRFPKSVATRLNRARVQVSVFGFDKYENWKHSAFVKFEKLLKLGQEYKPRLIESCSAYTNAMVGPWCFAFSKYLRHQWGPRTGHSSFGKLTYAGGLSSENLGDWMCEREKLGGIFYDIDRRTYDASICRKLLCWVLIMLNVLFLMPMLAVRAAYESVIRHVGKTRHGLRYKTTGRVVTGWMGTAAINTFISLAIAEYLFERWWHSKYRKSIPHDAFAAIGMGDDIVVHLSGDAIGHDPLEEKEFGLRPEINHCTTNPDEVTFLSGLFWRVTPYVWYGRTITRAHGPKIARQAAKSGWDIQFQGNQIQKLRGEMKGHARDWNFVPILRQIVLTTLLLTMGMRAASPGKDHEHRIHASMVHTANESTWAMASHFYQLPAPLLLGVEKRLAAVASLPCQLDMSILEHMLQRDQ